MSVNTVRIGEVQLTRVGYADILVEAARVGLSPEQVAGVKWAEPLLRAQGAVQPVTGDHVPLTDEVSLDYTGGHTPGHQVVRIDSRGEHAVVVGHLAVSPLHLATGECPQQHMELDIATRSLEQLAAEDAVLIGPLWPEPGAGRWNGRELVPISG